MPEEAHRHRGYGRELLSRGLFLAARDEFLSWLAIAERSADPALIVPALNGLAKVAHGRGEVQEALAYLERARSIALDARLPGLDELRVLLNLLMLYTEVGRLDEALALGRELERLKGDSESGLTVAYWLNLSMLHWRRQEWVQMRQAARNAYERSRKAGDTVGVARAMTNVGIAHMELGADRLAERDLVKALRLCEGLPGSEVAYVQAELGRLYFQRGENERALEAGRQALSALLGDVELLDKEEVARVSRLFGTIFSTSGQRNLGLKYLNRAAAYFSQLGFRAEWQRSTELIGQVLSVPPAPRRNHLTEEIHRLDFLTAVLDLTDDLESVDPYLRGHSERVAALAVLLAEECGVVDDSLRTLSHAARLHDVGMVAVDVGLLHRDGPLSETELRRVALHTVIGEEMLRPYGLPAVGLSAVRHHHEHYDGSGDPDGLSGEEIPLAARLIAVVDIYDSLTSDRSYRKALSHDQALVELSVMAGRELDPVLVSRFLDLHKVWE